jgi:hypothetical protein
VICELVECREVPRSGTEHTIAGNGDGVHVGFALELDYWPRFDPGGTV